MNRVWRRGLVFTVMFSALALLLLGGGDNVHAQSVPSVSNESEAGADYITVNAADSTHTKFTTGNVRHRLERIRVMVRGDTDDAGVTYMTLMRDNAGLPGSILALLSTSTDTSSVSWGFADYSPPGTVYLEPFATYWVRLTANFGIIDVRVADVTDDENGLPHWTIGDNTVDSSGDEVSEHSLRMSVYSTESAGDPLAVSNRGKSGKKKDISEGETLATSFRTGSTPRILTKARVHLSRSSGTFKTSIYSDSSGVPGTLIRDLSQPGGGSSTEIRREDWTGTPLYLSPSTTYWLVIRGLGGDGNVELAKSNDEDPDLASGWSIGNDTRKFTGGIWITDDGDSIKMGIFARTPQTLDSVTVVSEPLDGDTYKEGENLEIEYKFSTNVNHSSGTARLNIGTQARQADFISGSGTDTLLYAYRVQSADVDTTNGFNIGANSLGSSGSSNIVTTADSHPLTLSHSSQDAGNSHKVNGGTVGCFRFWCADLEVAAAGGPQILGFRDPGPNQTLEGSLSNRVVRQTATDLYLVNQLVVENGNELKLALDRTPNQNLVENARLRIGTQDFPLSSATLDSTANSFTWTGVSLSWSAGATVRVSLDILPVAVQFEQSSYLVNEGDEVSVKVTLEEPLSHAVGVPITSSSPDAVVDQDYSGVPDTLTVAASSTEATITFAAADDQVDEQEESVTLGFGSNLPDRLYLGATTTTTVRIIGDDTLVNNLTEVSDNVVYVGNATGTRTSQGFHTGDHPTGYRLTGVSVAIDANSFSGSETLTLKIYDAESNGTPRNELYTLTTPAGLTAGSAVLFPAPAGAKLEPDTNYHVVFQGSGGSSTDLSVSITDSNDQTGESNWGIENAYRFNENTVGSGRSIKIGVHGARNNAATGAPAISGEPRVGITLSADTSAIMDEDGLNDVSYSYQWIRVDDDGTSNPTEITGATDSIYTLTAADEGKRIIVMVSFTDDNLIPEERTSAAYPETGMVIDDTLVSNLAETTHTSSVVVGNRSGTAVAQGFGTGSHDGNFLLLGVGVHITRANFSGSETATFKIYDSDTNGTPGNELYALRAPGALTEGSTVFFTAPAGAKLEPNTNYHVVFQGTGNSSLDLSLALTASDNQTGETGWTIEDDYRLSENLSRGGRSVKMSIYGVQNSPATGDPTIAGEAIAGETLTAETSAIMDADGLDDVSYSYQWVRVDEDGSNPTPITGEMGSSYTLTVDDVGKRVRVRVSFTDDDLIPEERTSAAYPADGTVIDDALVSNLAETTHTSRVVVGNRSGTAVAQGFGTGSHDGNFLLLGVGVHITRENFSGSETATFKIYDSDTDGTPGNELYALRTPGALTEGSTVFFTAPVGAKLEPNTNYHVVFQGTGNSSLDLSLALTASDNQTGETGWTIEDAYRFNESLLRGGRSVKMSIYGVQNNPATGDPTIAGEAIAGETLTAATSAIMDADRLDNVRYSYQWVRVDEDGSNPTPITGEMGSTYTLSDDDVGKRVRVRVSFTDDNFIPEERTSDAYPAMGTVIAPPLVRNLAETTHSNTLSVGDASGTAVTQGFGTGSHDGGYRLTGVSVHIGENNFSGSETATFKIYDSEANGTPRDEVYVLTTPTLTAGSTALFDAPAGAKLEPDTIYHVVFQGSGNSNSDLKLALTASDTQTGETGWTIEDAYRSNESIHGGGRSVKMSIHGSENNAATGDPTISGDPRVGFTLTAHTAAIMDADDLNNVSYSYEWIRVDADGTNPTPITGEMGSTYMLTTADEGKKIIVTVSFTDDNSVPEERTSEAYPEIGTILNDTLVGNLAETTHTSSLRVGNSSGTESTQGFHTGDHVGGYRLIGVSVVVTDNRFSGAETATFKIYDSEANGTPRDDIYTLITPAGLTTGNTTGTVFFAAPEGTKLEPDTNYHVVFQGTGNSFLDLELAFTGSDDQTGETGWTVEDASRIFEAFDIDGRSVKMGVHGFENSAATGDPTISGDSRVGLTLTADTMAIMDADGLDDVSYSYQWVRVDEDGMSNATPITGETGSTYTLTAADEGKRVRVRVSFTDDNLIPEERTSEAYPEAGTVINDTLVSNMAETSDNVLAMGNNTGTEVAQGFHTGDHSAGYRLTGVSVFIVENNFSGAETATLKIYDSEVDGTPRDELYMLITPTLTDGSTAHFAAPDDANLEPDTNYHLVLQGSGNTAGDLRLQLTSSNNQAGEDHWTIEDAFRGNELLHGNGDSVKIGIHGGLAPPALVSAVVNGASLALEFNADLDTTAPANDAFTVTKGSGNTEQTLTGTPSITGRILTLTLETAVVAADTNIKVDYEKPDTNPLKDTFGNETESFTDEEVQNALADSEAPELHGTTAPALAPDGITLTITFNEALRETSVPVNSAFTVKATPAGGSEETLALATTGGVTVDGSTVALKLAKPIAHSDTGVKVKYDKPQSGSVIEDAAGNDLESFGDQAVTNGSLIPRVSISREHADASPGIAHAEYRVTRSNTDTDNALTVNVTFTQDATYLDSTTGTIEIAAGTTEGTAKFPSYYTGNTGGDLTATVAAGDGYAPAIAPGDSATVQMKVPTTGKTITISHARAGYTVTEGDVVTVQVNLTTGAGVAQPREDVEFQVEQTPVSARAPGDYSNITNPYTIAPGDWSASGTTYTELWQETITTVDDTEYEGAEEFTFELGQNPIRGHMFYDPVCPPGTQDGRFCDVLVTITDNDTLGVTDAAVSSTVPASGYYGATDAITFKVTFNGSVTVDTTNGTPQFAFDIGGNTRQAGYASGSGTAELTFSYTVTASDADDHDGISWGANALRRNSGTIRFTHTEPARQVDANLDLPAQGALSGHKVDTEKPTLTDASALGTEIMLTYSEELNTTAPANTAFSVTVNGGTAVNPTGVSIAGGVVTLTLAAAVNPGDTVTLTYTVPNTNPIKDLSGKEADPLTDEPVMTAPPVEVVAQFDKGSYDVDEGDSVDVIVLLDRDPERTVTILIETAVRNEAVAADFSAPTGVTFASGEIRKEYTFTATDDPVDDEGEWALLTFGTLPTAVSRGTLDETRVNIIDLDDPLTIESVAVTSTPTGGYYVDVRRRSAFTITFSGPVAVDTTGGTPQFEFELAGGKVRANYFTGSGTNVLVFTHVVVPRNRDDHDGISWDAGLLLLNGGTMKYSITEEGQSVDAQRDYLAQEPLSGHKVDTNKPTLQTTEFDDEEVFLTYSEDLNTTAPATSAFTVSVDGGTAANPTDVSIEGRVVTLTLASAIARGSAVTVSYTAPNTNPLKRPERQGGGRLQQRIGGPRHGHGQLPRHAGRPQGDPAVGRAHGPQPERIPVPLPQHRRHGLEPGLDQRPRQRSGNHFPHGAQPDQRAGVHLRGQAGVHRGRADHLRQGGRREVRSQGSAERAHRPQGGARRRRGAAPQLGRPARRHPHRIRTPPPPPWRQRLESGLDGGAGKRGDHHVAHPVEPAVGGAVHDRAAHGSGQPEGTRSAHAGQTAGGPQPAQRPAGPEGRDPRPLEARGRRHAPHLPRSGASWQHAAGQHPQPHRVPVRHGNLGAHYDRLAGGAVISP